MGWREEERHISECYDKAELWDKKWPKAVDLLKRLRERYVGENNPMHREIEKLLKDEPAKHPV